MADEIAERTVNLVITTSKVSFRTMTMGLRFFLRQVAKAKVKNDEFLDQLEEDHADRVAMKAAKQEEKARHGKTTVKKLIGQNEGVKNVEVSSNGMKDFERIMKKYGVNYAITKDTKAIPPKYMVFVKARDLDALQAVLSECTAKQLSKDKVKKPSILARLKKFKELIASIPGKQKVRNKNQERDL